MLAVKVSVPVETRSAAPAMSSALLSAVFPVINEFEIDAVPPSTATAAPANASLSSMVLLAIVSEPAVWRTPPPAAAAPASPRVRRRSSRFTIGPEVSKMRLVSAASIVAPTPVAPGLPSMFSDVVIASAPAVIV